MSNRINVRPSNRYCSVVKTSSLSSRRARKEIERREGVHGGFGILDTGLPAVNETLFKAYDNGKDLIVAVCALTTFNTSEKEKPAAKDSFEMVFDPHHDHIGFFQFVFEPGQEVATYHHLPYEEAHSTSFPEFRVKGVEWACDPGDCAREWGTYAEQWLFVRLAAEDVFRNGAVCGFNIVRNNRAQREASSWNPSSGIGYQDATGLGHLRRHPPAVELNDVRASLNGSVLSIESKLSRPGKVTARLIDPRGSEIPLSITTSGKSLHGEAKLHRKPPGRYRLYPQHGKAPAEPEFIAIDLALGKRPKPFKVGLTIDVVDDLFLAPYTPESLQAEMNLYASSGLKRIYWIDYTPAWLKIHKQYPELVSNARKSEKIFGDLLPAAVTAAHKAGMEIVGVYKPYDLADRPEPRECIMQTHPEWFPAPQWPVTQLRVYSDQPIDLKNRPEVKLWLSDDNIQYRRYRGAFSLKLGREKRRHRRWTPAGNIEEDQSDRNWYLEISNLRIRCPFMAVEIEGGQNLTHRAHSLLAAWDSGANLISALPSSGGSRKGGFMFWTEWPTWRNRTPRLLERTTWGTGTHGVSFLPPPSPTGLLEPSYSEVRAEWLRRVKRIVDAGADGVDIRTLCHHNGVTDYMAVAFAEPVRSAFRKAHGREVTPSWEDCERVRQLRGDFYTEFMRQGSEIAHSRGKKFIAHLECGIEIPEGHDQRMQMILDWEQWLKGGILDEVTLKWWTSQNPCIHERVLPLAKKLGVPVHIIDRNSSLATPRAGERAERLCLDAQSAGFDGLAFYEAADYKYWTRSGLPEQQNQAKAAIQRATKAVEQD